MEEEHGVEDVEISKRKIQVSNYLLGIFILLVVLKMFVFPIVKIKGNSMVPGLDDGGYAVTTRIYQKINPGDVVTLLDTKSDNSLIIKRVMATEGDEFRLSGDTFMLNGKKVEESYLIAYPKYSQYNILYTENETKDVKDIVGGKEDNLKYEMIDNTLWLVGKVPKGKVFVLGDNRVISKDSRQIGYVDCENIKGKLLFKIR